ncbi:hypothetical protein Dimus_037623 [Dionaea muscipula]
MGLWPGSVPWPWGPGSELGSSAWLWSVPVAPGSRSVALVRAVAPGPGRWLGSVPVALVPAAGSGPCRWSVVRAVALGPVPGGSGSSAGGLMVYQRPSLALR